MSVEKSPPRSPSVPRDAMSVENDAPLFRMRPVGDAMSVENRPNTNHNASRRDAMSVEKPIPIPRVP
jgi:hypothetical protein